MAKRRPSGDGMVRKREDGRWEGRIVIGHKENGDPIFRYIYADTQKELTAKLRQNITAYQGVDLTEKCRMTLSEWLDRWLEEYMAGRIRSTSMDGYRRDLDNHVKPYIGEKPLLRLSAEDLRSLYQTLMERGNRNKGREHGTGLSPTTVRGIHNTLHRALKTAVEEGLLPVDPAASVTPPRVTHKAKTILNHEQLEILKSAVKRDEIWGDFFLTELTAGLRRGEVCGLKWEDFDEAAGTLKICRTIRAKKGGGVEEGAAKTYAGTRTILLLSSTDNLLRERKRSAVTQWIFPDPLRPERPVSPGSAYRRLKAILEETGLPDLLFHDLRHFFATNALEHGVDIKTLSTIIGHVSGATTLNVYAHVTDEMRQKAADCIDRGIAGAEPSSKHAESKPDLSTFRAVKGKYRKPGTGCVTQINDHLWEGRYSPKVNGKRIARNIYAATEEECEEKLAELIAAMKKEVASLKAGRKAG